MLNPLLKSLMLAPVSCYIFYCVGYICLLQFLRFPEVINEGRVFIRQYPITLKLPFTPRSIY